ncbi:MAG: helicase-related protein [Oliverpabstia sp.]
MHRLMIYSEDDVEEQKEEIASTTSEEVGEELADTKEKLEPYEAYIQCMRRYGTPVMSFLMSCTGCTLESLADRLDLYQDPVRYDTHKNELDDWYPLSSYIFNQHIPRLYKEAEKMEEKYPGRFKRNLQMLVEHYPKLCGLTAYDLPIGSRLVPNWLYGEIFKEILELGEPPAVSYNKETQRYSIRIDKISYVVDYVEYGTKKKGISKALIAVMNGEEIVVKDPVWDGASKNPKYVRNEADTVALLTKIKDFEKQYYRILSDFLSDSDVYECICQRYCDSIGGYYKNKVHCDWVKVPGLEHVLRDYQKDGIGAAIMNQTTFFSWGTGAGKSLGMLAAASEMKRLEICRKILMVIPNGSLENFVVETEKYYPSGHYLIIYPKQFSKKKEYYLELVKEQGDEYDAVIMAISSYMMLDMSKDYYIKKIDKQIQKTQIALNAELAGNKYGEDAGILKRRQNDLMKKKEELLQKKTKITDCFENLGFDGLFLDECQEFKNVSLKCGFSYIKGVTITGSPKCDKNMEKVHWILRGTEYSEGRVVFATATPQKNSISETYVWQKYLSEEELAYSGMHSFQEWMRNFTETETKMGVSQDLQSMSLQTRLKYHNLTGLHGMMSSFMNYYCVDQSELKLPKHGPYNDVVISATEDEITFFEEIAQKLKAWHDGILTSKEYNPLIAMIEGRACSSDNRLVKSGVIPKPGTTKVEACSGKVFEIYRKYAGTTQVVFCDLSVPKESFNLYDEMKKQMIQLGIPAEEIVFIHDADSPVKKKQLLSDFQNGIVRVLIGSTQKMGVGLNIHHKLKAVHHFDCPYSPSDLIQRNGRAIREGNENEEVLFFRYIKEHSYDAVSWDRVEMKQGWIEAFNSPLLSEQHRDMDDLADNTLSYGEAVAYALGKPEMRKFVETDNEMKRVLIASRKRSKELQELKEMISDISKDIAKRERYITIIDADLKYYDKKKKPMTDQERKDFGERILNAIRLSKKGQTIAESFLYQGFKVIIPANRTEQDSYIKIRGVNGGTYTVKINTDKPLGVCQILNHYLGTRLSRIRDRQEQSCMTGRQNIRHAWEEIEKGNPYIRRLEELRNELERLEKELELSA